MLHSLVTSVSAPAFVLQLSSLRVTGANNHFARLTGASSSELDGRPCTDVCAGQDSACLGVSPCPVHREFQRGAAFVELSLRMGSGLSPARVVAAEAHDELAFIAIPDQQSSGPIGLPRIQIRALGPFDVRSATGQPIEARRPQSRLLLKLLLMQRGHPLRDETLLPALWPNGAPTHARDSLRVLVHDLRRALEPSLRRGSASRFIVRSSGGYEIPDDAPVTVDIDAFDRSTAAASRAGLLGQFDEATFHADEALHLYRGPLFEGDRSAVWFSPRRAQFRRAWLTILALRAALFARSGDTATAITMVEQATAADPSNEQAQRLHLLLLAAHHGRTAALQRFVELSGEFRRRFGIAPSRETADLAAKLSGEASLADLEREYWPLISAPPSDFPLS